MRALIPVLAAGVFVACHGSRARITSESPPVARDVSAAFQDTATTQFAPAGARDYDMRRPAQRDSLRKALARERAAWSALRPPAYRMLVRVSCFCPGQLGWLLVESRDGKPSAAWKNSGVAVPITEWSVLDVDRLFGNLERSLETHSLILIAFDSRWHFPSYMRSSMPSLPDSWSMLEARALRPR